MTHKVYLIRYDSNGMDHMIKLISYDSFDTPNMI